MSDANEKHKRYKKDVFVSKKPRGVDIIPVGITLINVTLSTPTK